ncbi:MAG: ribonuclease P protein component [Alphaproteobacteria bacterium]|nr:ribonuclease P protein component [Alphaproteobacteria bacterium]
MPIAVERLKTRSQFLAVAATRRKWAADGLVLQARAREDGTSHIGIGFTATKKVGNAVVRNRSRRRLKEAARVALGRAGIAGYDYVAIARAATQDIAFDRLVADFEAAARRLAPRDTVTR